MSTVLISGASGFIGSHLAESFAADGHRVVPLRRGRRPGSKPPWTGARVDGAVVWDPESGTISSDELKRVQPDIVVNLAGEPIAQRWTPQRRKRIRDSRVNGTRALAEAIATLPSKPRVFISGSAVGYYGAQCGDELLDEDHAAGSDFLAQTAREWEEAAQPATRAGIRVVTVRTGLVLGTQGGVLERMLVPFRLGIGGRLGGGAQWMSWIALDDAVRAFRFLVNAEIAGPVNLVAPEPVRNAEFTKVLGRVVGRPTIMTVPKVALELIFGTMADNTILASQRVVPKRLAGAGFQFRHPRLEEAVRFELRR